MPDSDSSTGAAQNDGIHAPGVRPHNSMTDAEIEAVTIGKPTRLVEPIRIVEYDPEWPRYYDREEVRIRAALGDRVRVLEHIGSTSVPGLAAKPLIDLLLVVVSSADESAYAPDLESAGYTLRIREPNWHEHRMLKGPDTDINLHVFSVGCPEIDRVLLFRDWLRSNIADRQMYERAKRDLALRDWKYVQNYADAKSTVVEAILERAKPDQVGSVKFNHSPVRRHGHTVITG